MPGKHHAVFALPDLGTGGAQRVMLSFASALARRGWRVDVAVLAREATQGRVRVPQGIACVEFGMPGPRQGLGPLLGMVGDDPPDLLVSVMGYLNLALLARRAALPPSTRVIAREANALSATLDALPRWFPGSLAYRLLYRRADRVIAPTDQVAAEVRRIARIAEPKLAVLPNPVDADGLRARAATPRRQAGAGPRFVAAGRLTVQKGFERLLRALAASLPEAQATIFGEGPERAALESSAHALGVADRLALPGFAEDLPAWIAGADAFLLPSHWEGLPNVALESLALGTPVVAVSPAPWLDELAARAPAGAVRVVAEDGLADALRAIAPRATAAPFASLLPACYSEPEVHARFAALAEETLRR
jgi:glycosyltransferase involved in cell wall biosynthesis